MVITKGLGALGWAKCTGTVVVCLELTTGNSNHKCALPAWQPGQLGVTVGQRASPAASPGGCSGARALATVRLIAVSDRLPWPAQWASVCYSCASSRDSSVSSLWICITTAAYIRTIYFPPQRLSQFDWSKRFKSIEALYCVDTLFWFHLSKSSW